MKCLLVAITSFFFLVSGVACGENDKEFYLIDPVKVQSYDDHDKRLVDSLLMIFHDEESDSIRLEILASILTNCSSLDVMKDYLPVNLTEIQLACARGDIGNVNCKYFSGGYLQNKGYVYDMFDEVDSALVCYEKAKNIYTELNMPSELGVVYTQIGLIYSNKGLNEVALDYLKQSCEYVKSDSSFYYVLSSNYRKIGTILSDNEAYDEALYFFKQGLKYARLYNDIIRVGYINTSIAVMLSKQGKVNQALLYCDSALSAFEKEQHIRGISYVNNTYSGIYFKKNELEIAKRYAKEGLKIGLKINENVIPIIARLQLVRIAVKENDVKNALELVHQIQDVLPNIQDYDLQDNAYNVFIALYKQVNDFENAFRYQKLKYALRDSVYNNERKNAAISFNIQHQYEKQKELDDLKNQQQLALAEQQKRTTQIGLVSTIAIALLILAFTIYSLNRLQLIRKQRNELKKAYNKLEESTRNQLAVSNLNMLKSQMNPHFIFNLLNSIQELVLKGNIDESYTYMSKFAHLVRQTLHFSDANFVDIEEEIELLNIYLELEKLRFTDDFKYVIIDNNIEDVSIPPLLIQPFVENAIVHGLLHKKGKKLITIEFTLSDQLNCKIYDNGIGRDQAQALKIRSKRKHQSFSTRAIEQRFKLLSDLHNFSYGFAYNDIIENDTIIGTEVNLTLPYKAIY